MINGNMKKDKQQLAEARDRLQDLRDVWVEAIKLVRSEKVAVRQG